MTHNPSIEATSSSKLSRGENRSAIARSDHQSGLDGLGRDRGAGRLPAGNDAELTDIKDGA